jgi:hypothetical protein
VAEKTLEIPEIGTNRMFREIALLFEIAGVLRFYLY